MGLAHEKKSYLQEKANLFEIGSRETGIATRTVRDQILKVSEYCRLD